MPAHRRLQRYADGEPSGRRVAICIDVTVGIAESRT
jgi:hypothetical protein